MTSSISNSRIGLPLKAAAVFLVLFIGYNLLLAGLDPQASYCQNQWQQNDATAENYVFGEHAEDTVIVGSSMSARLDLRALGQGFRNLSFSAGSSATGLEIISRSGTMPKVVLIETNRLLEVDSVFTQNQFRPLVGFFKRRFPAALTRNQPVNLLVTFLKEKSEGADAVPDPKTFGNLLRVQKDALAKAMEPDSALRRMEAIQRLAGLLASRNIQLVFFRMPIHPDLDCLSGSETILQRFQEAFPRDKYRWLDAIPGDFETSDGVHLTNQSASAFSNALLERTRRL